VTKEDINETIKLILESGVDSVETVFEVPTIFHPYNIRSIDEQGFTTFLLSKERAEAQKTGKRPKMYAIGTVYTFHPDNLWKFGTIQGEKSKSVIISHERALDIDEPFDLVVGEAFLKFKNH
jgi:CMP-N-acetylneuraminic acid synthetase